MNTSKLKAFAPKIRVQLMEAVSRKLDVALSAETADLLSRASQVASLRRQAERNRDELVERVAYTWFNRLAALRFLDARGWHPFHMRVLTAASGEELQPELLKETRRGALPEELRGAVDPERINALLDGRLATSTPGGDPQGEVYRDLVLGACRYYHSVMPFLFEAIDDETELLLPDDLLTATSVAQGFRVAITDADCEQVEVLGWLYQFYISEKKDAVMARKKAVPTEDVPAVTQLFTPHWIVQYLVQNSLGRLWLNSRPDSELRKHMDYYVPNDGNDEGRSDALTAERPEEIRLLDPACGSGHMLTYAFDLLVAIYTEAGYPPSEIPVLILKHNLYGAEICPRAGALAAFALTMKAREVDRRFFQRLEHQHLDPGEKIRVFTPEPLPEESVQSLQGLALRRAAALQLRENADPAHSPLWAQYRKEYRKKYKQEPNPALFERLRQALQEVQESALQDAMQIQARGKRKAKLLEAFEDAEALKAWLLDEIRPALLQLRQRLDELAHWDLYGALIRPDEELVQLLEQRLQQLDPDDTVDRSERIPLERILDQLHFLEPHYHIVVANPPYMGGKGMTSQLSAWADTNYPDSKSDLFAMFMERGMDFIQPCGYSAMVVMQSWMFLSSYESLRAKILDTFTIESLVHMGNMVMGIAFGTSAVVFSKEHRPDYRGAYCFIEYEDIGEENKPITFPPANERNKAARKDQ